MEPGTAVGSQWAPGHRPDHTPSACAILGVPQREVGRVTWGQAVQSCSLGSWGAAEWEPNPGSRAQPQAPFTRSIREENSEEPAQPRLSQGRLRPEEEDMAKVSSDTLQGSVVEHQPRTKGGRSESQSRAPAWVSGSDSRYKAQPGLRPRPALPPSTPFCLLSRR